MTINTSIVVALSNNTFTIGKDGVLPWSISEDLKHFSKLTQNGIIVMGRKTYESIPQDRKPLDGNRIVVVVTSSQKLLAQPQEPKLHYVLISNLDHHIQTLQNDHEHRKVYICGGQMLYKKFMGVANTIHVTLVEKQCIDGNAHFPTENFDKYHLSSYSDLKYCALEQCHFRFLTYKLCDSDTNIKHKKGEAVYIDLIRDIINNGTNRPDRTGTGTRSVFSRQLRFDLGKSFPLLTTKAMAWKSILKELIFFLKGSTNTKDLEAQGVNIWKGNTSREFLDQRGLHDYAEGDMGPMYFYQVRHWGHPYQGCNADYTDKGFDQLTALINGLKKEPFSRRHLLTTYNPTDVSKSVLAPCHGLSIMFYVDEETNGELCLSCQVVIRSSDVALGLPFNIASYAAFTQIIAKQVSMKPKELVISTGDTHIYSSLQESIASQLGRSILPAPILEIDNSVATKDFKDITMDDFTLIGYIHHPAIKMGMAI